MKIIKRILFTLLIIIIILCVIVYLISRFKYGGNIKRCLVEIVSKFTTKTETKYVLVLGVSEDIDTELTDTIMIVGYNPDAQKAFLVSIPRDTFVGKIKMGARASDKINSKYAKSIEETRTAVEELSGLKIDNYVVVKTSTLRDLVDLIGGVEFDVPIDMEYDDPTQDLHIKLEKGKQTIDGDKAEQLLRFRHNNDGSSYPGSYGDNDFGRMKTRKRIY